jgi:hypothetical protein
MDGDRVEPADERRHPPRPGPNWEESWYLDFTAAGGGLAGYVRLALRPGEGTAWFWAAMVGGGPTLVTMRDHEVALPTGRGLEVRAPGLWTELVCETPLDHWSVGLEAFGVALDDPLEAWRRERGDPWALGLDVEWEGAGPCRPWSAGGYWQACAVSGDVLVGAERFSLDGSGTRIHEWGDRPRSAPSGWVAGRLDDGTVFAVADPAVECDAEGLLRSATFRVDGREVTAAAAAHAPVLLPGAGRLARARCRYTAAGGAVGQGWAEWFVPVGGSGLV